GPQAVLPYSYAGTMGKLMNAGLDRRFFHRLGASLLDRTICATAGAAGCDVVLGTRAVVDPEAAVNCRYIVNWGSNTSVTNIHFWKVEHEARKRGARIVTIDPYKSPTAQKSDWWIPVRPGTDAALALGVMHVIFREGRHDDNYLPRPDLIPRGTRTINMVQLAEALHGQLPGRPVKALFVYNSNPAAVAPDQTRVLSRLAREDLFTVVHDQFQTDTADYADIVLPATSQLEHFDIHSSYGHLYVQSNNPAIAPLGEAKPNTEVFRLLARAMGLEPELFEDTDEELAARAFGEPGASAPGGWGFAPGTETAFSGITLDHTKDGPV